MRVADLLRGVGLTGFGLAGSGAALASIAVDPQAALAGWLAAAVLLQAVPLGALILLAMMRLVPGRWERALREPCEAAAGLWCFAALAFVPVLIGAATISDWPAGGPWGTGGLPFLLRTAAWFAVLAVIARSQVGGRASPGASAAALAVMTLGATLLAVDWFASLEPQVPSAGFGLTLFVLEACAAYLVIMLLRLTRSPAPERPGLLGGLLVLFLLMWLCLRILPDVAGSSLEPAVGDWPGMLFAAALLGTAPLLALMLPSVRRSPRALVLTAAPALAGKCLEFAGFAIPGRGPVAALAFLFALIGLGSLAAAFLAPAEPWRLPRRRAAPVS